MKNIFAWLVATLFFAYQYILRVMPNVIVDDMAQRFGLSAVLIGQLAGVYYISYTLTHIPVGILLDHIGPRKIIPIAIFCTVLGSSPLMFSNSFLLLLLGKLLLGAASSVGVLGLFKVIRISFAPEKFTFIFGISVFIALLAAMYGGQPVAYSVQTFGWNATISSILCAGILLSIVSFFAIQEKLQDTQHRPVATDLKELVFFKKWLVISAIGGLMIGPMEGFADSWGTKFFLTVYQNIDASLAAFLPSLILFGLAVGSPLIGFLSSRFGKNIFLLICCAFVMLISFYLVLYQTLSEYSLIFTMVVVGIASSYQTLIIYLASSYVPSSIAGLTAACSNMVMMIFGYFFHASIGALIGDKMQSAQVMTQSISVILYAMCAAILCLGLFAKFSAKINPQAKSMC